MLTQSLKPSPFTKSSNPTPIAIYPKVSCRSSAIQSRRNGRRSCQLYARVAIQMGNSTTRKIGLGMGRYTAGRHAFSATKVISALAGVAVEQGLIKSIDDPMRDYALDDGFDPIRTKTTQRHLYSRRANEGTLFDKPDTVDRNRFVGAGADNSKKGTHRDLKRPGNTTSTTTFG